MAKTDLTSVAQYIASKPKPVQRVLRQVRATIRKTLPGAEELISYQIPAYKLNGRMVIYFAGWTHHYSLYPCTAGVVTAFKDELAQYEVSKGTIRFPHSQPVPLKLIAGIARFRATEAAAAGRTRRSPKSRG